MLCFFIIVENYWAKGKTLGQALNNFHNIVNDPLKTGDGYILVIYEVKDEKAFANIGMNDMGDIVRGKEDRRLYQNLETF